MFKLQLAKKYDPKFCKFPTLASPKIDGVRALFSGGHFYSRQGHMFQGLVSLEDEAHALQLKYGVGALDGELVVKGDAFDQLSGKLRSFNNVDDAMYYVFDLPNVKETLLQRNFRLADMDQTEHRHNLDLGITPNVLVLSHMWCYDHEEVMALYNDYLERGYEGLMVKDPSKFYEGKRTWAWQKVKKSSTIDLVVVGTLPGTGKYEGMCGKLVVMHAGIKVAVGTGLSDAQRAHWGKCPEDIIGKTIEIGFQEVTAKGSLRHPALKCVRGDK